MQGFLDALKISPFMVHKSYFYEPSAFALFFHSSTKNPNLFFFFFAF